MAGIISGLSRQTDDEHRDIFRDKGVIRELTLCVMNVRREITLKSMLAALWNLSAQCPENAIKICEVKVCIYITYCLMHFLVVQQGEEFIDVYGY